MTQSLCLPFPMRGKSFLAQIVVPRDMTTNEAERLCALVMSLAMPGHAYKTPESAQVAPDVSQEGGKGDTLGFVIEGGILSWMGGGCRPATDAEMAMWEALPDGSATEESSGTRDEGGM